MRVVCSVLAAFAAVALVVTAIAAAVTGDWELVGWLVVGPLPFYLVGLVGFLLRPENLPVRWILVCGSCFALETCLGDAALYQAAETWSPGWLMALAMLRQWVSMGSSFGALGLTATFPLGRPHNRGERALIVSAGVVALVVPVLNALSAPTLAPGLYAHPDEPPVASVLNVEAFASGGPITAMVYRLYPMVVVGGLALLVARYRSGNPDDRRRIRWLFGWLAAAPVAVLQMALIWTADPGSAVGAVASLLLWPVVLVLAVGSLVVALFAEGVFGIDQPARRRLTRRVLRVFLGVCTVAVAMSLGLLAGRLGGTPLAVVTSVAVAIAARPLWRAVEVALDRWLFGARLDGYDLLSRFGESLETSPSPASLSTGLAEALTAGLDLTWVRVRLEGALDAEATAGTVEPPAAAVVPLTQGGQVLGQIECGTRRDGSLLDEDLRLLGIVAAQAAAAASTLRLTAELADRLELIRVQAAELAASRQRVVSGQDAERRRIQQDLHDGVQQGLVALSAKVSLAQQRLRRGDPAAAVEILAELQGDLRGVLADVRDVAYTIHPPILSDRGLVEAVEAQAGRSPVPTVVHADAGLREARFDERTESVAWYALAEAMSNVVKHADAAHCDVSISRRNGSLLLSVRDDGRGFDTGGPRGLGLTGMADRVDAVGGRLSLRSSPGSGTILHMELPVDEVDRA